MRGSLLIRLLDEDAMQVSWVTVSGSGQLEGMPQSGPLSEVVGLSRGRRVHFIVPGYDVVLSEVSIPTKNRQRLLTAIPYALEEQIIGDVDDHHFAIGTTTSEQLTPVAIISKKRIEAWLEKIQEAEVNVTGMVPENLCVPWQPGEWCVLVERDRCNVRTGATSGFTCDPINLLILMRMALEHAGESKPQQLRFVDCTNYASSPFDNSMLADTGCQIVIERFERNPLHILASGYLEQASINLLQNEYVQRDQSEYVLKPWYPAAALFAGWILLIGVSNAVEIVAMNRENAAINQQITKIYKDTFPDAKNVPTRPDHIKAEFQRLRSGNSSGKFGFLGLLGGAAEVLASNGSTQISSMNYRDGHLDVELTISDLQSLEQLKQSIESNGLSVEIRSATSQNQSVSSRLRITGEV